MRSFGRLNAVICAVLLPCSTAFGQAPGDPAGLYIGPIPGLTTTWHPAPEAISVPLGTTLLFKRQVAPGASVVWRGARETARMEGWTVAECLLDHPGPHEIKLEITFPDGATTHDTSILEVESVLPRQIRIRDLQPSVDALVLDARQLNDSTYNYYRGRSIAGLQKIDDNRYRTSVDREIRLTAELTPEQLAPLVEWRIPRAHGTVEVLLGPSVETSFHEPGVHIVWVGEGESIRSLTIETYRARITSHQSGLDVVPEGAPVTFTAETDPPGFEENITWLASTKYGTSTPVMGHGRSFTVQFDNTFGGQPEWDVWTQWLGVRADDAVFGQDQKEARGGGGVTSFVEWAFPSAGQKVGGPVLLMARYESLDPPGTVPFFEFSQDGFSYQPVPVTLAPDFSPGFVTTTLDTALFPSGPLYLRVRNGPFSSTMTVLVNHLPTAHCEATTAIGQMTLDCSPSEDPDGEIVSYEWYFGDGSKLVTDIPSVTHAYVPGTYDLEVTVVDNSGGRSSWDSIVQVSLTGFILIFPPFNCGCEEMIIHTTGLSQIPDPRRPLSGGLSHLPAPLGVDPGFPTVNFEVEVKLAPGSFFLFCKEGQEVKRTGMITGPIPGPAGVMNGTMVFHKQACTAGRTPLLARCTMDDECASHTCEGGAFGGQSCDGTISAGDVITGKQFLCEANHGKCVRQGVGVCTTYAYSTDPKGWGNDDFRIPMPFDQGYKILEPGGQGMRWLDTPGMPPFLFFRSPHQGTYNAEIHTFEQGNLGECTCLFHVEVEWDNNLPGHRKDSAGKTLSGLTLIPGEFTKNCKVQ